MSICLNPKKRRFHGVIFFPRWIAEEPQKTVCYQNEHLDLMRQYRDAGPAYPKLVIDEFAVISFIEDAGPDRDDVINCAPSELSPVMRNAGTREAQLSLSRRECAVLMKRNTKGV